MQFISFYACDASGKPIADATVQVYAAGTQMAASLFDASGDALANPLTAGASGETGFAAASGDYDVVVNGAAPRRFYLFDPDDLSDVSASFTEQAQASLGEINNAIAEVQGEIGDIGASQDSAYAAQQSELLAAAAALQAQISQAQNFPSDFTLGSEYWTGGNGQIAAPSVAANNPLPGTFPNVTNVGVVYQTEANPETCNSFGSLGYIPGVPGTKITVTAKVQAITDDTSGNTSSSATGVGLLFLNGDFSLITYQPGAGLASHKVSDGWQVVSFTYTVPQSGAAPIYRPTFFYNVQGTTVDPLNPANQTQSNQQFQIAYLTTVVAEPSAASGGGSSSGSVLVPTVTFYDAAGSNTYTPPANTRYLRLRGKGAGGGGGGSGGTSATSGANGGNTSVAIASGNTVAAAYGGGLGQGGGNGYNSGGYGGSYQTNPAMNAAWPGQAGVSCGGYTYAPGGRGGGAQGGASFGSIAGQAGLNGCGGAGGGADKTGPPGAGGGEGAEFDHYVTSSIAASYTVVVGSGGAAGAAGTETNDTAGGKGGDGWVEITAYVEMSS